MLQVWEPEIRTKTLFPEVFPIVAAPAPGFMVMPPVRVRSRFPPLPINSVVAVLLKVRLLAVRFEPSMFTRVTPSAPAALKNKSSVFAGTDVDDQFAPTLQAFVPELSQVTDAA